MTNGYAFAINSDFSAMIIVFPYLSKNRAALGDVKPMAA
jgi:hypothetical protein